NKMITFAECGNHYTAEYDRDTAGVPDQWEAGAKWSWFMPWYHHPIPDPENPGEYLDDEYYPEDPNHHIHGRQSWWLDAFASPNVISRDMMPSLKASDTDTDIITGNDEYDSLKNWLLKRAAWLDTRLVKHSANYIANASFDSDKEDAPGLSNWTVSDPKNVYLTSEKTKSGKQALLFAEDGTAVQTITELPSGNYTLKLWVLAGANASVAVHSSTGTVLATRSIENTNGNYQEIIISKIAITTGSCDIILMAENNTDFIYMDDIVFSCEETWWTGEADNNNWLDDKNWSNGIPTKNMDVIILGGLPYYPSLKETDQAECDTITFKMGASVARTDHLDYNFAKVDLDILPNRWYTLSAPLRDMYSGDYFEEKSYKRQYPITYIRVFNATNPETKEHLGAGWSKSFNTLTEKLYPGLGFTVWAADDNEIGQNVKIQSYRFPRDSMEYAMYDYDYNKTSAVKIPSREYRGRFTYEELIDMNENLPAGATEFEVTVKEDDADYLTTLVGNPFMAHLDFNKFASANPDISSNGYYIWNGYSFDATKPEDYDFSDQRLIAPMQSFVVKKTGKIEKLAFTFDMVATAPTSGGTLRSARTSSSKNPILRMTVLRNGIEHSNFRLKYDPSANNEYGEEKDMWTMFTANMKSSAVLYSLLDGKATSIRTIGDLKETIELGIRTIKKGELMLRMDGLEDLDESYDVYLEDMSAGVSQNLRENPKYIFDNQSGNVEGRLFLNIIKKPDIITGDKGLPVNSDSDIRVYATDNLIRITSSAGNPIQTVNIYSVRGELLYQNTAIGSNMHNAELSFPKQVLIVVVTTDSEQKNIKVVLK
ncbi:hypothetical protein LJC11_05590, partial [Bacteroidales bacterium OttesenSCG-928-I21]|nr:hypothetical protein [Bacteroidales bacterium OttesenSCG-928-I21]